MGYFDEIFEKADLPKKINFLGKEFEIIPDAIAFSQLGFEKYEKGDYQGAVLDFTKAINAQPSNPNLYTMRGTAYEDMGDDNLAEQDFRKTLTFRPDDYIASYRLGMVFYRKQNFSEAIEWLKISYNHSSDNGKGELGLGKNNIFFVSKKVIACNLGNFLVQAKKYDEALKYLDEAITMDSNYANPLTAKGVLLIRIGNAQQGIRFLEKAAELGDSSAIRNLQILRNAR